MKFIEWLLKFINTKIAGLNNKKSVPEVTANFPVEETPKPDVDSFQSLSVKDVNESESSSDAPCQEKDTDKECGVPETGQSETDESQKGGRSPLLFNREYIDLVERCCEVMEEFEKYCSRVENDETRLMIEMMVQRMRDALILSGVASIDRETGFNIMRHTPVPMRMIKEGTAISEIIEPGLAIGNRVFLKAKVKIEADKN